MKSSTRNQLLGLGALLVAGGVLAFLAFGGVDQSLVYFWDVAQLEEHGTEAVGARVRLGGLVQQRHFDKETLELSFTMGMEKEGAPQVKVRSYGAPPQMFRVGIGVVVEGTYDGELFHADRVIVKHSNEYEPPAQGERPQELYKTLIDES